MTTRVEPVAPPPDGPGEGRTLLFRILGPLEVDEGGHPIPLGGRKQRCVLAQLLIRPNQLVSASTLIEELWGDEPPSHARNTLQSYVSHLRHAIGSERIQSQTPGYRLRIDAAELDATRFDLLLREARRALPVDPGVAAMHLSEALALWRGSALADVADERSLLAEAARLDELRLVAIEERSDALLSLGEHARIVGELELLVSQHPLRERLSLQLMLAQYRSGRQADALATFQRTREILADELGIDPSPDLVRLQEQILRHDPGLELRGRGLRGYRLLEKLGEDDLGSVFRGIQPHVGRDVVVRAIHERTSSDPDFILRFEREAQRVAALEHPHIVPMYDYWREPAGAYLVTRYMRGGTLASRLERNERLEPSAALAILEQVASGLAYAHREGVGHGAIDASAIAFDVEGNAYLSDFRIGIGAQPDPLDDVRDLAAVATDLLRLDPAEAGADLLRRIEPGSRATAETLLEGIRAVVSHDDTISGPPALAVRNPYKGLRPFTEADAGDFFGQHALTECLLERLAARVEGARFLALVGPSGSGKSSVIRAGLVPAIRSGRGGIHADPFVIAMVPGHHPGDELETALLRVSTGTAPRLRERLDSGSRGLIEAVDLALPPAAELLLVVDQFEEVFTLVRDEGERARFLEQLRVASMDAESRIRIIVTLRADFFDRPLAYPRLGELIAARNEAVPALTADEVEQAIVRPAQRVGVQVDPGLTARIIADVADQPGALPLVEFALTELFERRTGDRMTLEAYRQIGGVAGAISARAERLHEMASPAGRRIIKQVFLRLVTLGEGRPDTRRRVTRSELDALDVDVGAIDAVLDAYGRHRLLTFDREPATREPTVEIAHEALLTAWTRLRGWIDSTRDDLQQERRVARAAAEWRASDRDPSFLLRGARLAQVEAWVETSKVAAGTDERGFIVASVQERERELVRERRRRDHERAVERRSRRTLRTLVSVLAVAALVASSLTIVAIGQGRQASRESRIASARALAAAAEANLGVDAERSILLALAAVHATRSSDGTVLPEAEEALHRAVTASRVVLTVPGLGGSLAWSPDGSIFVTEGQENTGQIDIRDAATGRSIRSFHGHDVDVNDVAFSPDGAMLATTGDDGFARLWDPVTGERPLEVPGHGAVWSPSFGPHGTLFAAEWYDEGVVRLVETRTGRVIQEIPTHGLSDISFAPGGRRLAVGAGAEGRPVVVDVTTGATLFTLQSGPVHDVAWSPDGRWIATARDDGSVNIFEASTGERRLTAFGHSGDVMAVAWSGDSERLVSGGIDGTARVWKVLPTGLQQLMSLSAEDMRDGVIGVAFSPDGTQVMTGDQNIDSVKIWDVTLSGDAESRNLPAIPDYWGNARFTQDGRLIASGPRALATTWDPVSGETLTTIGRTPGRLGWGSSISVSAGRALAAVSTSQGAPSVWNATTGRRLFETGPAWTLAMAWSPDGGVLASAGADSEDRGVIAITDRSGRRVASLHGRPNTGFNSLSFSPDGALLAATPFSTLRLDFQTNVVQIWDWRRGTVVRTIDALADSATFDPSGTRVLVNGLLGSGLEVFDARTGRQISALSGSGPTFDATYSPDGSLVAAAGIDGVRIWDPTSGALLMTLGGHEGAATSVSFSPDGSMLASEGTDGVVRLWAMDVNDLVAIARASLTRGLTDAECRQYLQVEACPS
jgi:WD40 repeat protein/DNA-binding SARP family transcriptional activator